jgi:hypothetical protein
MKEQTDLDRRRAQIVEELSLIVRIQVFCRLYFDDYYAIYEEVDPVRGDLHSLVQNRNGNLTPDPVPTASQLDEQSATVGTLEEAIAKSVVHVIEGADDRLGDAFMQKLYPRFFSAASGRFRVEDRRWFSGRGAILGGKVLVHAAVQCSRWFCGRGAILGGKVLVHAANMRR